jgi:NAD(P)-dependent dehydrogenase (short-subunit alcohol dehydrogenase family)
MFILEGKRVAVVGGGSGIGRAVAERALTQGADVIISSRDAAKLESVAENQSGMTVLPLDMTDATSRAAWADRLGSIDHLVISASSAAHGAFSDLQEDPLRSMFDAKFFGPYMTAKAAQPYLRDGGSITFFSGVLSRRPGMNCSGLGAVNGAVESLTYGLALELGPRLRVNCVSPGMIRSDAYAAVPEAAREEMYAATGESLPLRRVGTVDEAAGAALFLMANTFTTGHVLDVDGGHMIRQYGTR